MAKQADPKQEKRERRRRRLRTAGRAAKAVTVNVTTKAQSAARARSGLAILIYLIAGLVILYLLVDAKSFAPGRIKTSIDWISSGFRKLWNPLVGA